MYFSHMCTGLHLQNLPFMYVHVHRAGLDDLYASAQKSLDAERKMRQQLKQELEMQKSVREEKDVRDYVI